MKCKILLLTIVSCSRGIARNFLRGRGVADPHSCSSATDPAATSLVQNVKGVVVFISACCRSIQTCSHFAKYVALLHEPTSRLQSISVCSHTALVCWVTVAVNVRPDRWGAMMNQASTEFLQKCNVFYVSAGVNSWQQYSSKCIAFSNIFFHQGHSAKTKKRTYNCGCPKRHKLSIPLSSNQILRKHLCVYRIPYALIFFIREFQ